MIKNFKLKFKLFSCVLCLLVIGLLLATKANYTLIKIYHDRQSTTLYDRNSELISIKPNISKYYAIYEKNFPEKFKKTLLQKEDKYFYYHLGINPISTLRASYNYIRGSNNLASSTITQQLTKILLNNESDRTFINKIKEAFYAISLEIFQTKKDILNMYLNSIFLGNNIQGINLASQYYFGVNPDLLTKPEIYRLVATIDSPSQANPFKSANTEKAIKISNLTNKDFNEISLSEIQKRKKMFKKYIYDNSNFELQTLDINCQQRCNLTIDKELTNKIRGIVKTNIDSLSTKNATNSAVVVLKYPENEILSIIGSPDPDLKENGNQINMAIKERPIGSTIKPFIYMKGFEKNLRPYTLVDDREYKYLIDGGFSFYPKNYDYKYRGIVNLHYALSNSLNVPTVKVLEYVGINEFNNFLLNDLKISPIQDLNNYQLGIALGELEMDLLSLSYNFSLFSNEGYLQPLHLIDKAESLIEKKYNIDNKIIDKSYIQLVNKILSDRNTGVEQFGLRSELNTSQNNVAIKTGTSREYHDSWIVGFTPDFLVAVWVGNTKNTPMDKVSGASGAGIIWNDIMSVMIDSKYNNKTEFNFDTLKEFNEEGNIEYGLKSDNYELQKKLLLEESLILTPHNRDIFLLQNNTQILLKSSDNVEWFINDKFVSEGKEYIFKPKKTGKFKIKAVFKDSEEIIDVFVEKES